MADNITITQGTGTTVAADDISSVYYPRTKVGLGADGTANDWTADEGVNGTGVARVTVATDDAMSAQIQSGHKSFMIDVAPTVTAGAYTAADCFGGKQTLTSAARASGGGGRIVAVSMFDEGANILASDIEVIFFDSDPSASTLTDNDALAVADADGPKILGSVILSNRRDTGDGGFMYERGLDIPYVCSGSANLFAAAVQLDTTAPDATDGITFRYHLIRD